MQALAIVWLPIIVGMFYFLIFAPRDLRKSVFAIKSLPVRVGLYVVVIALVVNAIFEATLGWSYVKAALAVAGGAFCVRGIYLAWQRRRRSAAIQANAAELPEDTAGETRPAEASAADQAEPQADPPLTILHLLGLAVCVALYLGLSHMLYEWLWPGSTRAVNAPGNSPLQALEAMRSAMGGVGAALAVAGLLLFAARRWRGRPFPVHPGEYLWVLLGAYVVTTRLASLLLGLQQGGITPNWLLLSVILQGLFGAMWLWAIVNVGARRWRIFLVAVIVANLLPSAAWVFFSSAFRPPPFRVTMVAALSIPQAVDLSLILLAYLDHRDGLRRPWTHWTGLILRLWMAALTVVNHVLLLFV